MSDETNPDLTALIHERIDREYHGCDHKPSFSTGEPFVLCEWLAEQVTAAGFGPVRAVQAERDAWETTARQAYVQHETEFARAESAEAALAGLTEGVEALADEWKWYEAGDISAALRALLAPTPDREEER